MKKKLSTVILTLVATFVFAQKPALDHTVYDNWKSISNGTISSSGQFIYYSADAQDGDGYTVLKDKQNKLLLHIERGTSPILTENEAYFIVSISPSHAERREARIKKKKSEDMPKDSLLVFSTKHNTRINYGPVKSYRLASKPLNHIAYIQESTFVNKKDTTDGDAKEKESEKTSTSKRPKKENILVLADLTTQDTLQFRNVDQYRMSPNEKYLVYTKKYEGKDTTKKDILNIFDIQNKSTKTIGYGNGNYRDFTFDEKEQQLIFLADKSPTKSLTKDFKVYYYDFKSDTATAIVDRHTSNMPESWFVSGDGSLRFDGTAKRIILGLAPIPPIKDTSIVDFEQAKLDIWHWQDKTLMSQQLINLERDLSRNYDAIYQLETKTLVPLMNEAMDRISYADSIYNDWAVASSTEDQKLASQWLGYSIQKLYLVSLLTGDKKTIRDSFIGQYYLSPKGQYILLFDAEKSNWSVYDIEQNSMRTLNTDISAAFADEENDMPTFANSYGIAGWSKDGKSVYIYDRYDIWHFRLDEEKHHCITHGYGRKNAIRLRIIQAKKAQPRQRYSYIDTKQKLLLSSFNLRDKRTGIFDLNQKKNIQPKEIVQAPFSYQNIATDARSTLFIYTKENFQNSPNLYLSSDFIHEIRFSDINPQQENYNWGTAELIRWKTPQGKDAEGIVYKPENFDPNKKYPVIAYFYETLTESLYNYHAPAPTPSRLNIPYFVSNDYIVFVPDIRYETGHPGKSAEEYVNSGMRHLGRQPWIDSTKMGIQGQSWGGYQVAHLITRTNMYAAAWAGAPVVNMISAYGGIRWLTGASRQFQYEHTQSRLGKNLWEDREPYIENSPLFLLDKVTTPVVIMSNDNDGAVPWYQGIEMFMGLRRLGKPVWMLNYNGDAHNLTKRPNRKDIQIRQSQFFDYLLKGKDAPKWITSGVPATRKGIDWGID